MDGSGTGSLVGVDVKTLVRRLRAQEGGSAGAADDVSHQEQLELAIHPSLEVRGALAGIRGLHSDVVAALLEDTEEAVIAALLRNPEHEIDRRKLFLRLAQRYFAGEEVNVLNIHRLASTRLTEEEQLLVLEAVTEPNYRVVRFFDDNPSRKVLEKAFDLFDDDQLHRLGVELVRSSNVAHAELVWRMLDLGRLEGHTLANLATSMSFEEAPEGVFEFFLRSSSSYQSMLVYNDTWPLSTAMSAAALTFSDAGLEFLDRHKPADASTWDALLGSWEGTVDDLLIACQELGPDTA